MILMKRHLLYFIILLSFSSCASTTQYVKFTHGETGPNNNARIYVLRPSIIASSIKMNVFCNEELIGSTGSKSFICWDVEEGLQKIQTTAENSDTFYINAKPGSIYYLKQTPKIGILYSRVSIELMDEEDAVTFLKMLKKPKIKYVE